MQEVRHMDALSVAVHLLPQVIAGIIWNIIAAIILHRVNNSLIMAVGAVAYIGAGIILSLQEAHSLYWAFVFPAIVIAVIGADFQFNVTNVGIPHFRVYFTVFADWCRCMSCSRCLPASRALLEVSLI